MPDPRFSIVIPARNAAASLPLVLDCLQRQEAPDNLAEILVVDDGSTDATAQVLRDYRSRFPFKYWSHPVSLGRSAARNLAWRNAIGEIVLFLDADMLTEPQWLSGYAEAFTQSDREVLSGARYHVDLGSDPKSIPRRLADLIDSTPESIFAADREQHWRRLAEVAGFGQYPTVAFMNFEAQLMDVCRDHPESLICAYSVITSNVGVRRDCLERVNGFDPFILKRGEDADLGIRLWEIGARFGYSAASRAYHLYTEEERDRQADLAEYAAFCHRNPYLLVAFIYLWFVYNAPGAPPPPAPCFRSLSLLAQQGSALMDFDIAREFLSIRHGRLPIDCRFSTQNVADYFVETMGIARDKIIAYLDRAVEQGIVAQRRNGRIYLDLYHVANWLRTRTTQHEYAAKAIFYLPNNRTGHFNTRRPDNLLSLQCRGVYEIAIDLRAIAGAQARALLNIPVPIETSGQTNVRIEAGYPEDLMDHFDPCTQMIRDYEIRAPEQGPVVVRYHFVCDTHERSLLDGGSIHGQDVVVEEDVKPNYPPGTMLQLQALLRRIPTAQTGTPTKRAQEVYRFLLANTRIAQTWLPDFCIVSNGLGPCVHQARLFVNLCRLMNIPARERCGAVFQGPIDSTVPERVILHDRGFSPFLHTWAEFYDSRLGWTPVELMTWGFGRRSVTPLNVQDNAIRNRIEEWTDALDSYCFGALDPYRIHCSRHANRALTYPTVTAGTVRPASHKLWWYTKHHLTVDFERFTHGQ